MTSQTLNAPLQWAFEKLAQVQGVALDGLRLQGCLQQLPVVQDPMVSLGLLCQGLSLGEPVILTQPDRAQLPLLAHHEVLGWCVLIDQDPLGRWLALGPRGTVPLNDGDLAHRTAIVPLAVSPSVLSSAHAGESCQNFQQHVMQVLRQYRPRLLEAVLATAFIGVMALATSLYSMQVYDRVIPTRSDYTLIVLTAGVFLTILIELIMKYARSNIMDHIIVGMDNRLSREIFQRLMQLRVDQLPPSVGSLAGQLRGYEQVRNFYTASTLFTLIDVPLAVFFMVVIGFVGAPLVAAVPAVFAVIAIAVGVSARRKTDQLANEGAALSNMKTGLLVEAVEGVETIKAGAGNWKFLSRWMAVNGQTIHNDLDMRHKSESMGYWTAAIHQLSYAALVAVGAYTVMQGQMTMGALIACSILSGRVLAPIMALPGLMVQHAHAKAATDGLNKLYQLKTDHHGIDRPLVPGHLRGQYSLNNVVFAYNSGNPMAPSPPALQVPKLVIPAGQRVAILGPIGSGKSTLLRLLSGLYHTESGRVLLDGLDITHISREVMSRQVGYLQQDHRLFQGTLRENLLIGMADPGDDVILAAMKRTGMSRIVAAHPKGLDRPIAEGGKGLSGGQRQLVAFTRLVLTNPSILLLDEPTATMDDEQERLCLRVLAEEAANGKTLVVVTHKPSVLPMVQRIIVVAGNRIVLDGPRDEVLQKINQVNAKQPSAPSVTEFASP